MGRNLVFAFVATAILYFAAFHAINHWRARKGPWQATFAADAAGRPVLIVEQSALALSNVVICFADETVPAANPLRVQFDRPWREAAWAKVVYQDPTTLPGVATLMAFGHEIELMPRALVLNRREVAWQSGQTNFLRHADRLPPAVLERRKYRREK